MLFYLTFKAHSFYLYSNDTVLDLIELFITIIIMIIIRNSNKRLIEGAQGQISFIRDSKLALGLLPPNRVSIIPEAVNHAIRGSDTSQPSMAISVVQLLSSDPLIVIHLLGESRFSCQCM